VLCLYCVLGRTGIVTRFWVFLNWDITVSSQDRNRWNKRYAAGAYGDRTHACALLTRWLAEVEPGRALDVACGAGRNAIYLASHGFEVDALDISAQALARAAQRAKVADVSVNWQEQDLDDWRPGSLRRSCIGRKTGGCSDPRGCAAG